MTKNKYNKKFSQNTKNGFFPDGTFRNVSIPNSVLMNKWFSGNRLKVYIILSNICFINGENQATVTAHYICKCLGLTPSDSNKKNINTIIREMANNGYISNQISTHKGQRYRTTHINQVENIYFDDLSEEIVENTNDNYEVSFEGYI